MPLVKAWATQIIFLNGILFEGSGFIGIFKSIAYNPFGGGLANNNKMRNNI